MASCALASAEFSGSEDGAGGGLFQSPGPAGVKSTSVRMECVSALQAPPVWCLVRTCLRPDPLPWPWFPERATFVPKSLTLKHFDLDSTSKCLIYTPSHLVLKKCSVSAFGERKGV